MKKLLAIGLVLIPFYEVIVRILPYGRVLSPDTRQAKMLLAIWIALILWLISIYKGIKLECKNKFLLVFIGFIIININLAPQFSLPLNGVESGGFWIYIVAFRILCFLGMFLAVSNMTFTKEDIHFLLKVIVWSGVAMSIYIFLQEVGFEQFYVVKGYDEIGHATKPHLVGTIGNSTLVSSYIAIIIPFALYLRKYFYALIIAIAVFLCSSDISTIAMIISFISYLFFIRPKAIIPVISIIILISALYFPSHPIKYKGQDNGRFQHWEEVLNNIKRQKIGDIVQFGAEKTTFALTGVGLGAHDIIYSSLNKTSFGQAHNEFIELLYIYGIIGLWIFIGSIVYMLTNAYLAYRKYGNWIRNMLAAFICSFIFILLNSFGSFPFQLGAHAYIIVFIVSILHNKNFLKGERQCLRESQSFCW